MEPKYSIKIFFFPAILFAVFFVFGNEARAAAIYYVDNTTTSCDTSPHANYDPATDTCGSGSYTVYNTIQEAALVVTPGSIVIVANGTYTDTNNYGVIFQIWFGGTESQPVIFRSEHKWGAVLDGLNNSASTGIIVVSDQSYIIIDGFEIKNLYETGILTYSTTSHITMKNNSIHNIGNFVYSGTCVSAPPGQIGDGILPGGSYHIIDSNLIHSIGKTQVTTCYHNWDHAIYGTYSAMGMIITNNIIYDVWTGTSVDSAANDQIISNNIIARLTEIPRADTPDTYLLSLSGGSMNNLSIQNNIFYNCMDSSNVIWTAWNHAGSEIKNNIKYGNCANWVNSGYGLGINYSDNIDLNPLFLDEILRNFHLQSNSPAIGKGTLTNAPVYDFDGNLRTGNPDIGAYEYMGVPPVDIISPAAPSGLTVQ